MTEKNLRDKSINYYKVGLKHSAALYFQDLLLCVSQAITHSTSQSSHFCLWMSKITLLACLSCFYSIWKVKWMSLLELLEQIRLGNGKWNLSSLVSNNHRCVTSDMTSQHKHAPSDDCKSWKLLPTCPSFQVFSMKHRYLILTYLPAELLIQAPDTLPQLQWRAWEIMIHGGRNRYLHPKGECEREP